MTRINRKLEDPIQVCFYSMVLNNGRYAYVTDFGEAITFYPIIQRPPNFQG